MSQAFDMFKVSGVVYKYVKYIWYNYYVFLRETNIFLHSMDVYHMPYTMYIKYVR
jgi:hypothetical protein